MQTMISKEMTFDCAHMLSGHKGKCANLHGHTYKVQVLLEAPTIDIKGDSSDGMVMDFADLKDVMVNEIVERFDHALILSDYAYHNNAESALLWWVKQFQMKFLILPQRTTAEHMAAYMCTLVRDAYLGWGVPEKCIPEIGVRLWETPTSYVEVFL